MQPKPAAHASAADTTAAVDAFMRACELPSKAEIEVIRQTILSAAPTIGEGIKWKAPSFRTGEYFATINLREKAGVGVILHLGAKVRNTPTELGIDDPEGMLRWLAKDRAMLVFKDMADLLSRQAAFARLIRAWIAFV
ncbi:MAG: DUF1801 domain-containing protein [Pseudomarimonas sp.]